MPQRVAQGGVALGLVMSMGAVVASAGAQEPTVVDDVAALVHAATTDVTDAEDQRTDELRAQAVQAAQGVVEQVSLVRADAEQAAVPTEVLAELDAATEQLRAAMEGVDVPADVVDRTPNVSRDAERTSAEQDGAPAASPDATTTPDATATPAPSSDPTSTATSDAATPDAPDAAAPATDAPATPAAEPSAAATGDPIADATLPDTSDPATTPLRTALDRVKQAAEVVRTTTEQKRAEAAAAEAAAAEAARVAAEQEAQRAAWKASLQGYANGKIPSSALCGVGFDKNALLRCDAAESLDALDAAFFAQFGTHLTVSDSYRSYAAQVACRANKGSLCATPGTSNHGLGVAVDLGGSVQSFGTAQHQWMRENAPTYQWTLPEWARATGSKPEPWHWEYTG
ncbi:D-alanyl-D-alanine carboxypeptidase family protein [Cellulomonas iranensis]|uniref:M15 family metallopeptidase n=1 Tax=Cellulomonas iranensis TaxID=76862 RepID=UPI001CF2EE53|nr:M15 family metallopeptidase [Cellulomonas iranensis]UCN14256.1 D-alanyl-D-alanine carboxypeptidase family protein [Cellulomonas iranensis]